MPRNNSSERRMARRAAAEAAKRRRDESSTPIDQEVPSVEDQAREVIEDAALLYDATEWMLRISHQCSKPETCSLPPKACSAVNQNMPPHLIIGQITD